MQQNFNFKIYTNNIGNIIILLRYHFVDNLIHFVLILNHCARLKSYRRGVDSVNSKS